MSLVIFDLDETLLAGDSSTLFCEFLVAEGIATSEFVQQDALMMERYHAQTLVLSDYIHFLLTPLQQLSVDKIDALMPRFVDHYIIPRLHPEAVQLVAKYQRIGVQPLIISATAEFIVKAIADRFAIKDVLAIQLEIIDGRYSGEIAGIPTFREGKVTRLQSWLSEQQKSIDGALFYSDSINDLPLLELVEHPFAVNPDDQLMNIALQRNWPVQQWVTSNTNDITHTLKQLLTQQEVNYV